MTIKTVDIVNDGIGPLPVEVQDSYELQDYTVYACVWLDLQPKDQNAFLLLFCKKLNAWVISNDEVVTVGIEEN